MSKVEVAAPQEAAAPSPPPALVKARHVLILGGLVAFAPLATDTYLPALPIVGQELSASMAFTQLTLTAFIIGLSLGQALLGPISDAWGRRRPLFVGILLFAATSMLCAAAPSMSVLIGLRFLQGLTGASGVVIGLAVARDLYSGVALARCVSLLMTVNFLAPIGAPVVGGQLLTLTSWRGIFVATAIVGAAFLPATAWGLKESLPLAKRRRGGLLASLKVYGALLCDRHFLGYALCSGLAFAGAVIYISTSPFLLQEVYKLSAQQFSLVFGINAVGLAIAANVNARLVRHRQPAKLLTFGLGTMVVASLGLLVSVVGGIGLKGILPALFLVISSLGLIGANATSVSLAAIDAQDAGSAAALLGVMQLMIGAIVAPLIGIAGATSAVPMATAIAAFSTAALLTRLILSRGDSHSPSAGR